MAIKQKSSRSARRLVSGRKRQNKRRLSLESLENRRVLASFVVTTHLDTVDAGDGVTSLREAVSQANSTTAPDTITFDPSLNGTPITLSIDGSNENLNANGDIDISRDVTILGNGIDQTIISGGGDDGIDESVFNTLQNSNTIFQNLTIRDGRATSGLAAGGAIAAQTFASGSLLIESVRITGNQATNAGGGVIGADTSNITIVDSMIDDNAGGIGGGISTFGILDIVNTTIDNNRTTGGVGGGVQVQDDSAVATIRSSTISNNTAGFAGGALANVLGDLTVINTTISGNEAVSLGGAVFTVSNSGGSADTDIQFSTIADNASTNLSAGVVHTQSESDGSSVVTTLSNNILANNTGFASSANITFGDFDAPGDLTFTSEGGNVFDDGAFGINIASDQINVNQTIIDPILADNGGPVATHALVANSPAIGAAQTGGLSPPVMDSRGQSRDTAFDSGAYELDTPSIRFDVNRPNAVEGLISEIQVQAIATAFDASDLRGAGNLSVDFTIAGENITSDDYSIASNSVTVDTSGATSNLIVGSALLTIQDDDLVEADESLSLTPDSADGGTLESLDAVSVNIVDNDRSAITLGDVIVGESDGTAIVPITLTNPVDIAVELNLRTVDNTAIAGTDFVGVANQTVTIPAGAVQANASVTISPNGIMDGDRDFTIEIDGINSAGRDIGGTLTRLDQPAAPTSRLGSFSITPDGQFTVYQNGGNLFQVPVSGGTATQLNAPLIPDGGIVDFQLSSDGSRVVYLADQDTDNVDELYSVPIAGGTPTRISGDLVDGGDVRFDFQLSSDGSRVVYRADQDTDNVDELYSVPIAGGTPTRISGDLVDGGDVDFDFQLSSDGSRVVYTADQDTDNVRELYSVPIEGGTPTRISGDLVDGGDVDSEFQLSSDGSRVVYSADQDTDNVFELYSVPIAGGTPTRISGDLVDGGVVDFFGFLLSSDGTRVVYRADQDTDNVFELYSVPIVGGTPTRISGDLVDGGDVFGFQLSSDGSRVVYTADQDTDNVFELYSVPIAGGTPVKLAPQRFGQSVTNESVLFPAFDAGTTGLFVTPLAIESKITIVDDDVATDPVITWDMPESIVFGTAISATQLDATADVAGTFVYTPVAGTVLDAGLGQTLSVTFTPTDTTNFNVVTATTTIDVDRANPVVTWSNPADIQLGTALDDDQLNATANVAGTFVYTPVAGTVLDAGDGQTLSVAFTPTDIDNFTSTTADVTINVIGPNDPTIDFGDAPEGYPVTLADDGARHAVGTLRLGTLVDAELDGSNSQSSDGDGADEDGVTMLSTAIAQADQPTMTSVAVTASEAGKLDAWVDFNLNGSWEQGEQIFDSVDVVSGPNVLSVTIPAGAQAGLTVARFRISTAGDLEPTGAAADGEVEDHLFLIETANQNSVFVSSPFAGTTTIEFSGDDLVVRFGQTVLFQGPTDEIANLSIVGSSEDDIVVVDASVNAFDGVALDGLGGNDQLILAGSGQIIQSESLISVTGLEFVDLTGTGPNSLSLTEDQIAGLPDSGTTLRIQLDSDDTFTPILDQTNNANNAIELTGSGVDGDTFYVMAESEGATFELSGLNWTNPILRFDSNNSGSVTAADALVIINQLRSREFVIGDTMNLIDPAELQTTFPLAFFDPSADNRLTALDALQVINEIRRLNSAPVESELIASDVLRSARGSIGHSVSSEHSEHLEHQASALQASAVVKESATDTESSDEYAFDSFSQHAEATDEALVDIYATIGLLSDASAE